MQEIIVSGDPEYVGTCITDNEARPDPSHCWSRAAVHIFKFAGLNFFEKRAAARACFEMVAVILKMPRPPRRAPVKWGWGKGWPGIR